MIYGAEQLVSIHAPRVGGDRMAHLITRACLRFNPRPRVGGDPRCGYNSHGIMCFNPRPRVGGDPGSVLEIVDQILFQSTPPARGATFESQDVQDVLSVSIHAPRVGGDAEPVNILPSLIGVSIHAPAWGAT